MGQFAATCKLARPHRHLGIYLQSQLALDATVQLRLRKKSARSLENVIGSAQFLVLSLKLFELLRSSVVSPGRWPASISLRCTHPCKVLTEQPIFGAIDSQAAHSDA